MKISSKLTIGFIAILSMQTYQCSYKQQRAKSNITGTADQLMSATDQRAALLSMQPMSQELISQSRTLILEGLRKPYATGEQGVTIHTDYAMTYIQQAAQHALMYLSLKKGELKSSSQKLSLYDYASGINNLTGFNVKLISLWDHESIFYSPAPLFKNELTCTKQNNKEICKIQLDDNAAKELQKLSKNDLSRCYLQISEILHRITILVIIFANIYDHGNLNLQCTYFPIDAFMNRNFLHTFPGETFSNKIFSYHDIIAILTATATDFMRMSEEQAPTKTTSWFKDLKSYF